MVDLSSTTLAPTSFADIRDVAVQSGSDVIIELGGGSTLTLQNVTLGTLQAEQFGFPAENDAPTSADAALTGNEDEAIVLTAADFVFNDIDIGDTLTEVRIDTTVLGLTLNGTPVANGAVISIADINSGSLVYTPPANENGEGLGDFQFSVGDGDLFAAAPSNFNIDVLPVADAPTSEDATVTSNEDEVVVLTTDNFAFSDVDGGDTLTLVRIDTTVEGLTLRGFDVVDGLIITAADIANGDLVYTPATDANGAGLGDIEFSVGDGALFASAPSSLTFDVLPVNDAPTGGDTQVSGNEDVPVVLSLADFTFNDVDTGDSLLEVRIDASVQGLELDGVQVVSGQVISAADIQSGKLVFTPEAEQSGDALAEVAYSVGDGDLFTLAPSSLTVNIAAVNDAPTAESSTIAGFEDESITFAASDFGFADVDLLSTFVSVTVTSSPEGLTLDGVDVTDGQEIALADISAGKLVYTPAANVNGTAVDQVVFTVSDGSLSSLPATLSLDIASVNDLPTGEGVAGTTVTALEDVATALDFSGVTISDVDSDDTVVSMTFEADEGALSATSTGGVSVSVSGTSVTLSGSVADINSYLSGANNIQYTGLANVSGTAVDTIAVSVSDGETPVDLGSVTVDITGTNDAPELTEDAVTTTEEATVLFNVFANDIDPDGDDVTISIDTTDTTGTVTLLDPATGAVSYDPGSAFTDLFEGQTATDNFTYVVDDGNGGVSQETVTVTITGEGTLIAAMTDVLENAAGASVGTLSSAPGFDALALGSGDVFTTSDARFEVAADGAIKLVDGTSLDFEAETSVDLTITRTRTDGTTEQISVTVTVTDADAGSAQDGFIAGGSIYEDTNDNGELDAGDELVATTDDAGNFELPPGTTGRLFLSGGTDISTGLPFDGVLSAPAGSTVLTPLTTLIDSLSSDGSVSVEDAEAQVSSAFGIDQDVDLTTFDPINAALSGDPDGATVFAAGSQVLSTVSLAGAVVDGAGGTDGQGAAFEALADAVGSSSGTIDLADTTVIGDVIATAGTAANADSNDVEDALAVATDIIAGTNEAVDAALADANNDTLGILTDVTQTSIVAQGDASTDLEAAVGDDAALAQANSDFVGDLDTAIDSAVVGTIEPDRVFTGTEAAETLTGAGGNDTLRGLGGDDTLTGAGGDDTFLIADGASDTITDFNSDAGAGELIDLSNTTTYSLDLAGGVDAVQSGSDVVITLGNGETLTLSNTTVGDLTSDDFTFAVNAAPTTSNNTVTTAEDTPYTVLISDFAFSDDDSQDQNEGVQSVRITALPDAGAGTLTLDGVDVSLNQEISAADIAGGLLVFTPTANANGSGLGSFSFEVSDGVDFSAASSFTFDVTAVNDAPIVGNVDLGNVAEDSTFNVTNTQLLASSSDTADGDTLTVANVALANSSAGTLVDNGDGTYTVTLAEDFTGTDVGITYTVSDGTVTPVNATATFDITGENDAPDVTGATLDADTGTVTITTANLGYSDAEADALVSITIATIPDAAIGILSLDGGTTALSAGATVTLAQLDAGNLVFVLADGVTAGTPIGGFTFTANDGALNSTAATISFDLAAEKVNAAPSGTDKAFNLTAGGSRTLTASDFGFTDEDSDDVLTAVRFDSVPAGLTLNGTAVEVGDVVTVAQIVAGDLAVAAPAAGTSVVIGFSVSDGESFAASESNITVSTAAASTGGGGGGGSSTSPVVPDQPERILEENDAPERISTGDKADVVRAGAGNDTVEAGEGDDRVNLGAGDDFAKLGLGRDTSFAGADDVGNDTVSGGAGDDIIGGGAGDDSIDGGADDDLVFASAGDDFINGGSGGDELFNGSGNDTVIGGSGDDTLWAGADNDTLTGGGGSDTFVFGAESGDDLITDFDVDADTLNLSFTVAGFADLAAVTAAASLVTVNGVTGVSIDLGGGQSVLLEGLALDDLTSINFVF